MDQIKTQEKRRSKRVQNTSIQNNDILSDCFDPPEIKHEPDLKDCSKDLHTQNFEFIGIKREPEDLEDVDGSENLFTQNCEPTEIKCEPDLRDFGCNEEQLTSELMIKDEYVECYEDEHEMQDTGMQSEPEMNVKTTQCKNNPKMIKSKQAKTFECKLCGKILKNKRTLIAHELRHATKNRESYKCMECGKSYQTVATLNEHIKDIHINKTNLECKKCGKFFAFKTGLVAHSKTNCDILPFQCEICGEKFKFKKLLSLHGSVHFNSKTFECQICGKMFQTGSLLSQHKLIHSGVSFACDLCDKTFTQRRSLKTHIQCVHSNTFTLECKVCSKKFKSKANLETHSFVHSGLKQVEYNVDGKKFTTYVNPNSDFYKDLSLSNEEIVK